MEAQQRSVSPEKIGGGIMKSLLIMSCSKTKENIDMAPAIEMYDGQAYRVLKKNFPKNVTVLIISAKYGVLHPFELISWYDQEMTVKKAIDLRGQVQEEIMKRNQNNDIEKVFINLGYPYSLAISDDLMRYLDENFNLQVADGYIGMRLHQLKEWLKVVQ